MKDNTKKTLKIYGQATIKYKYSVLAALIGTIVATSVDAISPLYFKDFFNLLAGSGPKELVVGQLVHIMFIVLILYLISWVGWRVTNFTSTYFQSHAIADLTNKCFAYMHQHSYSYFTDNFGGSLVKRVKWFANSYEGIADRITWNLLPLAIQIVLTLIILSRVNIYIGLALGIWIVIFLLINWSFTKFKIKYDLQKSEAETENSGLLADTITNHNNVKLFNGYESELKRFSESSVKVRRLRRLSWDLGALFSSVQGLLTIAFEIGIFTAAIYLWQKNILTIGDFVLIQSLVLTLFMRIWDFGNFIRRIYENLADAEEMTILLNTPHDIQDVPNAKSLAATAGKIEFKKVVFNYNQTRTMLNKFNLTIAPQEKVAVIGPSGAGKTTIIKLLFRMHDLTSGHILIDNQDISKVSLESLWKNVSLVPQDPILFHRILMENIRYGRMNATDEEVIEAAKAANCHDFIVGLDQGYDTFVGERGVKLSGGERQRVAIARAILKNVPILVLDEATSSLDSESEMLIQKALGHLMENKTVIVIAHRLSTIRKMDRIIVIDKGEIVEEGTHDGLLENKQEGIYHKLWQLQAGGFVG